MTPADAAHIAMSQYSQSQKLTGGCSLNPGISQGVQINVAGRLLAQPFRVLRPEINVGVAGRSTLEKILLLLSQHLGRRKDG